MSSFKVNYVLFIYWSTMQYHKITFPKNNMKVSNEKILNYNSVYNMYMSE